LGKISIEKNKYSAFLISEDLSLDLWAAEGWAKTEPIGNYLRVAIEQWRSCIALWVVRAPLSYLWEAYLCRSGLRTRPRCEPGVPTRRGTEAKLLLLSAWRSDSQTTTLGGGWWSVRSDESGGFWGCSKEGG